MCTGSGDGNDAASNMDPGRRSSTEFTKVLDPGERVERACCWLCPLGELLVGTILSPKIFDDTPVPGARSRALSHETRRYRAWQDRCHRTHKVEDVRRFPTVGRRG